MSNDLTLRLMQNIEELSNLELSDAFISLAIFSKMIEKNIEKRLTFLQDDLNASMTLYNVKPEAVSEETEAILKEYELQLNKVAEQFRGRFSNIQLELQEIECNQKIALVNFNEMIESKIKILESYNEENEMSNIDELIEKQERKAKACIEKFNNYNELINECLIEMNICQKEFVEAMNEILSISQNTQLMKKTTSFQLFINKIKYIFTGKSRFQNNVIIPKRLALSNIEMANKNLMRDIDEKNISFTAIIARMRENINRKFAASIS